MNFDKIVFAAIVGALWTTMAWAAEVPITVLRARSVSTTSASRQLVYASVPARASDEQIVAAVKKYALQERKTGGIDEVTVRVDLDLAKNCEKLTTPYLIIDAAGKVERGYPSRTDYSKAIDRLRAQGSCKALY
ncbi:hypothetical protein [Gloeobacter kilaueensis]|uniref:Uncharacterized protein n=1 Tax=Gloeobacter kilaueensis (strain ATCC BAA-2537 / CCAP 1431/1 / ULC 316 / JS1) TaxID=1183438 RepID=U5QSB9_GLOK1|nr:hypothetical protein [Gloeobacter kilaueensis]AGY60620.1 hypothetical protein GKIL_4374 [Gloeobacter kilaueensis JS1]